MSLLRKSTLWAWLRDIAIASIASIFIVTFLYQPVRVEGTSMAPGLRNSDRLFINKFLFHFEKIQRGEIVVFHYPLDPTKSYIKRVIALPGDTISIARGKVFVDGRQINEPYVPARYRDARSMPPLVMPPDEYFVMGDHRSVSSDSRSFGPVDRDLIYGKADFIYWPESAMGVVH
jgi:signal peptidase I